MKIVRSRDSRASITNVSEQVDVKVTMNVVVVKVVLPVFARRFHVQIVKEMMIAQLGVNANSVFVFLSRDAVQTMTARRPRFARIDNASQIRTCVETMLREGNEICAAGQCVPRPPECQVDGDCGDERLCVDGQCVEAPPECRGNDDCDGERICVDGKCFDPPPECRIDGDCGDGEVCVAGRCQPVSPECRGDGDCAPGQVCEMGACVPAPLECVADGDCPAGQVCLGGQCLVPPPECVADGDCPGGEICVEIGVALAAAMMQAVVMAEFALIRSVSSDAAQTMDVLGSDLCSGSVSTGVAEMMRRVRPVGSVLQTNVELDVEMTPAVQVTSVRWRRAMRWPARVS